VSGPRRSTDPERNHPYLRATGIGTSRFGAYSVDQQHSPAVAGLRRPSPPLEFILFDLSGHSVPVTEVVGLNLDAEVHDGLIGIDPDNASHLWIFDTRLFGFRIGDGRIGRSRVRSPRRLRNRRRGGTGLDPERVSSRLEVIW